MTLMWSRIFAALLLTTTCFIVVRILLVGHREGEPIVGCRKILIMWTFKLHAFLISIYSFFCWNSEQFVDLKQTPLGDYSKYLGPDYQT